MPDKGRYRIEANKPGARYKFSIVDGQTGERGPHAAKKDDLKGLLRSRNDKDRRSKEKAVRTINVEQKRKGTRKARRR